MSDQPSLFDIAAAVPTRISVVFIKECWSCGDSSPCSKFNANYYCKTCLIEAKSLATVTSDNLAPDELID